MSAARSALEVLAVWVMPWRAAALIRSQDRAIAELLDMTAGARLRQEDVQPARHLRLVRLGRA